MHPILLFVVLIHCVLEIRFASCEEAANGFSEKENVPHTFSKRDSDTSRNCKLRILVGCSNESLVNERGTIDFYESNFATRGYAPNQNCHWSITVHPDKIVILYVESIDIDTVCNTHTGFCDSLSLSDGKTGKLLASFPNVTRKGVYETTSNMASIVFRSNGDDKYGYGFKISYASTRKELKTMCGVPKQQLIFSNADPVPLSVSPHSFPWHVNIFSATKKEIHCCSGTIISRDAILTAAHCFDSDFNWSVYKVSAGKRSLYEVEESEMIYDIDNVFFHPNYTKGTLDNDVAIVKLRQKIAYTDAIRPVCRAEPRDEPPTNSVCVTTGWLHRSDRFDLTLSRVAFQPIKSCNIPSEIRRSNSICAGFSSPSLNVCNQREPGGALICQVGSQWIQYGVMSAGIGCLGPNLPGIFANIRKCNNWISTKIGSDCGRSDIAPKTFSRIVGGLESNPHSWPWQISLYKGDSFQCGGSIIANRWIMTAAHCFGDDASLKLPQQYTVVIGDHNLRLKDPMEKVYSVERIFRFPEKSALLLEFDIALIYLSEDIVYNRYVKPVCLARYDFPAGERCVVTGWGRTQHIDPEADKTALPPISDVLNELEVPLIDDTVCAQIVSRVNQMKFLNISSEFVICAGYLDGSKDSCFGDSGGPLVCLNETDGTWKQAGIVSYGWGCAVKDFPGFYTRVSAYFDWIKLQISQYPAVVNDDTSLVKQIVDGR